MTTELLEIQPRELKFTFELKKPSSCSIQLENKSNDYVAFKVKTTSPKKYCVRPNTGMVKPNSTCDFTVIMQAPREAPPDMQCKDKFLIQSTVVPFGTTEDDIKSEMFAKDSGKCVEEKKLRVVLVTPPPSPVLLPINGDSKQDACDTSTQKEKVLSGVENINPAHKVVEDAEEFEATKDMDELKATNDAELRPNTEDVNKLKLEKDAAFLNLTKDFEELKTKLNIVDSKLKEAELTVMKLKEERDKNIQEKDMLKQELQEMFKRKNNVKRVQVGFPFLYVCMVALIGLVIGYLIHPKEKAIL